MFSKYLPKRFHAIKILKGTGTRDLIWLKVVSLERSWWVGLTEDLKIFFKCFFIFLMTILKSLVVLAEIMPIANVNRIVSANLHSVCQFLLSRQPIADWRLWAVNLWSPHTQLDCAWWLAGRKPIQFRKFTAAQVS